MKKDTYFLVLDARQAATVIGIYESFSILVLYLKAGVIFGFSMYRLGFDDETEDWLPVVTGTTSVTLVVLKVSIFLTLGAAMGNRRMMVPWLVIAWVRIAFGLLTFVGVFIYLPLGSVGQICSFFLLALIYLETAYSLYVVTKAYVMILREKTESTMSLHNSEGGNPRYKNF